VFSNLRERVGVVNFLSVMGIFVSGRKQTQASTSGLGNHGNVERRERSSSAQRAPRRAAAPGRAGFGAEPQSGSGVENPGRREDP